MPLDGQDIVYNWSLYRPFFISTSSRGSTDGTLSSVTSERTNLTDG